MIGGRRFEIKLSTRWESGVYKFQQFHDQDYEYAICLGISPQVVHCWVISKVELLKHVIGHTPQHTGAGGTDTFWLSFPADQHPVWLEPFGGSLARALEILKLVCR